MNASIVARAMRLTIGIALITPIVFVIGCVDASGPVKSFADATVLTANTSKQSFEIVDQLHSRRIVEQTIAEYPDNHLSLSNVGIKATMYFLPPEHVKARTEVLEGLNAYVNALTQLAGNDAITAMDADMLKLGNNLLKTDHDIVKHNLYSPASKVTDADVEILTTAIREVGTLLVEWERQKAIKQAVEKMNPNIKVIAGYFKDDFIDLSRQTEDDYHQIIVSLELPLKSGEIKDPMARAKQIRLIASTSAEAKKAIETAKSLSKIADQLADAHQSLLDAINNKKTTFQSLIQSITTECNSATAFYNSFNSK